MFIVSQDASHAFLQKKKEKKKAISPCGGFQKSKFFG